MGRQETNLVDTIAQYVGMYLKKEELKQEIKEIEGAMESIEEDAISKLKEPVVMYGHTISIATRRDYGDWPSDIKQKEEELKELKARAKRVGNVSYEIKKRIQVK